jgi:hypothetical protein
MEADEAAISRELLKSPLTTLLVVDYFLSCGAVSLASGSCHFHILLIQHLRKIALSEILPPLQLTATQIALAHRL